MFILDTNVVSELRKIPLGKANPNDQRWAKNVDTGSLFLSAITILELEIGFLRLGRKDQKQSAILRAWLEIHVFPECNGRVFPVDTAVAQRRPALHVPDLRAERDALIAATALVDAMTIVTRKVSDLEATGARIFDPWEG